MALGLHYAQLCECALAGEAIEAERFAAYSVERAEAGEVIGISNAYLGLGIAATRRVPAEWREAESWFEKTAKLAEEREERALLAKTYYHQARLYKHRGDH